VLLAGRRRDPQHAARAAGAAAGRAAPVASRAAPARQLVGAAAGRGDTVGRLGAAGAAGRLGAAGAAGRLPGQQGSLPAGRHAHQAARLLHSRAALRGALPAAATARPACLPCGRPCRPDPGGLRRVVLATPIAESSLTLDGVRLVVDAGYRRAPLYDLATGISRCGMPVRRTGAGARGQGWPLVRPTARSCRCSRCRPTRLASRGCRRLQLVRASRASADQRRGRAGRTGPGVCYRLWDPGGRCGRLACWAARARLTQAGSLSSCLARRQHGRLPFPARPPRRPAAQTRSWMRALLPRSWTLTWRRWRWSWRCGAALTAPTCPGWTSPTRSGWRARRSCCASWALWTRGGR
jgi:hypothetical protein